ncbi:MAG: SIMPL domain-containing protein [Gammaproteobacteria bacterium]|nr:SIMPL domain-containing protein [Gammaproteobacteria bacterium]
MTVVPKPAISLRFVLALAVAALCLSPALALAQNPPPMPPRAISVSGDGSVHTQPDQASVSMAVDIVEAELDTAEASVSRSVRDFLAAARKLGISDKDLASGAVSVRPEYVWDEDTRKQKMVGYRVRRGIEVSLKDLGKLGDLLQAATGAGINEISPPALESSRAKSLQREALVKATQDAQEKAALLAKTLGVTLGPVLRLSADDGMSAPPVPMMKASRMVADSAESGNSGMGISTGEIEFQANVHAEFELQP